MTLLLDEMYGARLARALGDVGVDALTVGDLGLTGAPDGQVFAAARAAGRALLTENVADFTRLAAELSSTGGRHSGVLIALSARFSRRPCGIPALVAAVQAVALENVSDRVVFLAAPANRAV